MSRETRATSGIRFSEAAVLFVLILGLTIFVGVRMASRSEADGPVTPGTATSADVSGSVMEKPAAETVPAAAPDVPDTVAVQEAVATPQQAEPIRTAPVTYAEAEEAYHGRDYDMAADLFAEYSDTHPQNAWGHYMLGMSLWKAGDPEGAFDGFENALSINPDHIKSLVNRGRVLLELEQPTAALTDLQHAWDLDQDNVQVLRVLARALAAAGDADSAMNTYRDLLRDHPDDVWALNNLGLLLIRQDRGPEAVPALALAVQMDPGLACARNNLGMALELSGRMQAASEAYAAALDLDPRYAKARASADRLAGLVTGEDAEPFDLAVAAAAFRAGMEPDLEVAVHEPAPTAIEANPGQTANENR